MSYRALSTLGFGFFAFLTSAVGQGLVADFTFENSMESELGDGVSLAPIGLGSIRELWLTFDLEG